jgi:outer membrane beta-barrel protein
MAHRAPLFLSAFAAFTLLGGQVRADDEVDFTVEEAEETFEIEETTPVEDPVVVDDGDVGDAGGTEATVTLGEARASWEDIVVVVRRPFLKSNRFELVPSWGLTLNDNMIRHYTFNGQANWYLTEVLAVGFEAQLFAHGFLETYDLVARQHRRLPTLNKYNWGGGVNFHYAPIYAKFAILNRRIVHLEGIFTVGAGVTQSEVLPRDPALPGWTNMLITPNVGFTARVFLAPWLTLNLSIRDYIFIDRYEDVNRSATMSLQEAKDNADPKLVNHIMFHAGVAFWFPMTFRYTTFR